MILFCTQRAAKELAAQIDLAKTKSPTTEESWFAHAFYIGRKKCLIVTHGFSLFSSVLEGYKKTDSKDLQKLLKTMISKTLFLEGFSAQVIQESAALVENIQCVRTTDKIILGSMNDLIRDYKYYRDESYGCFRDYNTVMYDLNRKPMKVLKMTYPVEAFMKILGYPEYKTSFRGAAV